MGQSRKFVHHIYKTERHSHDFLSEQPPEKILRWLFAYSILLVVGAKSQK